MLFWSQHHEETSGNAMHQQSQKPSPKDELYVSFSLYLYIFLELKLMFKGGPKILM